MDVRVRHQKHPFLRARGSAAVAMSRPTLPVKRWAHAWLHSDLIGIPFTLAVCGIIVISIGLYPVIGKVAGLFKVPGPPWVADQFWRAGTVEPNRHVPSRR
jgi:hypothetical protein